MTEEKEKFIDDDLEKAKDALKRAATKAREIARQTGTPLVIYRDGKIIKEKIV